ncbi:MAG TPA: MtrB/PioB family decaheme-associated outer membrane protein [Aromatoleum sp.]|uniref:MtrB/PioB family decaheme-associated outer membrane protein n=1 Tax=Aromatoleum sp. TaxID=2307007 RepID=UPI002B49BA37|nr:MtrB/PioB family decaheme-associated outer membrane protein [Aromatoleum sp.]HJV28573.1 MtrB/PioB family decaheme-associated outer membrane protein [Aromatoleum sp.]
MTHINSAFRLSALATALLAIYGPAAADDAEIRQLSEPDSSVSVGVGHWNDDRFQQGMYDGMRSRGFYGLIDADIRKRDEATGTWYTFEGERLGLDTRRFRGEVLQQGNIGASVSYSRIDRDSPLQINTGLQGIGHENQTISGTGANALPHRDVSLGVQRDLLQAGFYKNLMRDVDLKVSFKNEEKDGTRNWGMGSNPYFLVEPIDSTTRQLDVTVEYTGERLQLAGGYAGSWYGNHDSLVMATIKGQAQPGNVSTPNPTPLTLPLDNEAHQFFINAGYSFTPSTRATLKLQRSVATQDENLPTWNLAAPNNRFVDAPRSLDGKIVNSLVELGLTSRATSDLTLNGSLRYYDSDDRTPISGFVGSNTTHVATVHDTPFSYTTKTGKFEASYRLPERFKLIAGVDVKDQDRSVNKFIDERYIPYRERIDETTYRLQLRRSMSDTLNGSVTYLHSERDGSSYVPPQEADIFNLINPLHLADRTRNKWRLSLDWAPVNAFNLQFNVEDAHDEYGHNDERPFGLRDGRATLVSVDARYALSDVWQLTGWASHDMTRARQLAGRWDRTTLIFEMEKDAVLKDKGDSVGLGLRGGFGEKLKVGADVQWTRTRSFYDEETTLSGLGGLQAVYPTSAGVTAVPLPDIENKLVRISMFAKYAVTKEADVRLDLIHEQWKTDDWTWSFADGSPFTYGTTVDGTTVSIKPKETSNFIGMRYIVRFQ